MRGTPDPDCARRPGCDQSQARPEDQLDARPSKRVRSDLSAGTLIVQQFTFYEFFAGGGMARAGLGEGWRCLFANDIDPKKAAAYRANWGGEELWVGDVAKIEPTQLPGEADLAWASFPCQDLSLAGAGAGLKGERSGSFWGFWDAIHALRVQRREPRMLMLENVCGALTSHQGRDFVEICRALNVLGYRFGAMVIDAIWFVPQSRPRLFILALRSDLAAPPELLDDQPSELWHPRALRAAYGLLRSDLRKNWLWWRLPSPPERAIRLSDLIEDEPTGVRWNSTEETERILAMMSRPNLAKVEAARRRGGRAVGAVYKRTRKDEHGGKIQRAEVRFDEVAGCLRTPAGGSSRQTIMVVDGQSVRTRLLSPREAARLMGLPDNYKLPVNYNDAYHLAGDGVVVPVVRHIAEHLLCGSAFQTSLTSTAA